MIGVGEMEVVGTEVVVEVATALARDPLHHIIVRMGTAQNLTGQDQGLIHQVSNY